MTIANEVTKLDTQRKALADNLVTKSVEASQSETLSELVPKVLQVPQEGGGLDTNDATAYAEHILEGYTAYARGQKIVGTAADTIPYSVPEILTYQYLGSVNSQDEINITCEGVPGKLLLVACHLRGGLVEFQNDWTLITQSPSTIGLDYPQTAYLFGKIAIEEDEYFSLIRNSSTNAANYFLYFSLDVTYLPTKDSSMSYLSDTKATLTYIKPQNRFYIIIVTSAYWPSTGGIWKSTPPILRTLQEHAHPRLGVILDESVPTSYVISTGLEGNTEDYYRIPICAAYF